MRVALLIGCCPAGSCGVGDYTRCLSQALNALGVDTQVVDHGRWTVFEALTMRKWLRQQFDLVHVQYPTAGFGRKLGPQTLSCVMPCITTIHELSQRRFLRKASVLPLALCSERLIFTNTFELLYACKCLPWIRHKSSIVPVGSNLPRAFTATDRQWKEIVYFGLLMPKKGLEDVIELGRLIAASGLTQTIGIIGRAALGFGNYVRELRTKAAGLPVNWYDDLDDNDAALKLAQSAIAYLPYPDGASDRRTTLKAALLNGVVVITREGRHTTDAIRKHVRLCNTPLDALAAIRALLERRNDAACLSLKAERYGNRYNWNRIAKLHLRIYRSMLRNNLGLAPYDAVLRVGVTRSASEPTPEQLKSNVNT